MRIARQWEEGQELELIEMVGGILLRPKLTLPVTDIDDVAGCLAYRGKAKSLEDMEQAISKSIRSF